MKKWLLFHNRFQLPDFLRSIKMNRWILLLLLMLIILLLHNVINNRSRFSSTHLATKFLSKPSTFNTGVDNLTKMLVVSHFNEDLGWIDLYLGERLPHIVYTRSNDPLVLNNFPINKGREAVAYLRYIIDYYENLPSLIAFTHGHRTSVHQKDPSDIVIALRAVRWNKYTFMPLTSARTVSFFTPNSTNGVIASNFELWRDVLQQRLGPSPPQGIDTHCCATFVVRREAILKHPRSFYSRILEYMLATPRSDLATGQTLEFTWHIIFGEKPKLKYETCDIFYCDSNGTISVDAAERQNSYL